MKPARLQVPPGKTVTIGLEELQGGLVVYLRPKTVLALKTLAGVPVRHPARLRDTKAFEIIEDRKAVERLAPLLPDRAGKIGGTPYDLVHALITSFEEKGPIPKQVRIVQRLRERKELRAKRSLFNLPLPQPEPPDREWLRQLRYLAEIRKIFEAPVPDWLQAFSVYSLSLVYDDVVVEANGTLVIAGIVTSLSANNFYMHQGAKVVQESPYLTVEITGELRGDLP